MPITVHVPEPPESCTESGVLKSPLAMLQPRLIGSGSRDGVSSHLFSKKTLVEYVTPGVQVPKFAGP